MAINIMGAIPKTEELAEQLLPYFRVFPQFCLGEAFLNMPTTYARNEILGETTRQATFTYGHASPRHTTPRAVTAGAFAASASTVNASTVSGLPSDSERPHDAAHCLRLLVSERCATRLAAFALLEGVSASPLLRARMASPVETPNRSASSGVSTIVLPSAGPRPIQLAVKLSIWVDAASQRLTLSCGALEETST